MNSELPKSESPIDLTGQSLGEYVILRRLGRGGMADVYLAKQNSLNRNVALKVLKPELARDESYVRRFHQEAMSAATVVQANIVQIYEVKKIDGLHFIAQEYVQGRNLRQYLDRHGAVEPVMALTVLRQCAMALQQAAKHDVVHRDIKPENIMLSTAGEVKVTDFGLARINNNSQAPGLTQVGITMGTPLYMSPEQVEGKRLDCRSDIYSLGVTAYHILAGEPPFNGENALAIAIQQVNETATELHSIRPDVPAELCSIIHSMIAKDPARRPQDAVALMKELRKVKLDIDEDWENLIDKLAVNDSIYAGNVSTLSQAKLAATQQLQAVMRGNIRKWWKHPAAVLACSVLCLAGLFGGIWLANSTAMPFPLDVEEFALEQIPRKDSAEEQYRAAYYGVYALGPDEDQKQIDFWKAVLQYFPLDGSASESQNVDRLYYRRAQARLGEVYLSQRKLDEALNVYAELEDYEEVSDHFRVMGTAGKAIVYDLSSPEDFAGGETERQQKVRQCLRDIGSQVDLLNQFMREAIQGIRTRYPANPAQLPVGITVSDS